jgi:hypothetical protein
MIGKVLLAGAIAVPTAAAATVAATGVAWVDVREGGPEGHRIVLPIPLLLADVALTFVPDEELDLDLGEAAEHLQGGHAVLKALAEAPDGEYVRVDDEHEQVLIEKVGGTLKVRVRGDREDVTVNVPLDSISEIIDEKGRVHPRAAIRALRHARFSTLVEVQDGDDHVKISVF